MNDYSIQVIKTFCRNLDIKRLLSKDSDFEFVPTMKYMLRIGLDKFTDMTRHPTIEDVLHSRQFTSGFNKVRFRYESNCYITLIDVGGQRPEREKWVSVVNSEIQCILYFASLVDYKITKGGDTPINRLQESIELFVKIMTDPIFEDIPVIILLNKMDLFPEKLKMDPLNETYSNYKGSTIAEAQEFISSLFFDAIKNKKIMCQINKVKVKFICSYNSNSIKDIINYVKNNIFEKRVKMSGM